MQACLTISTRVSWCIRLGIVKISGSYVKQGYLSGGAGYVLSKEALKRFVEAFKTDRCTHSSSIKGLALGRGVEILNAEAGDSRDTTGKKTFIPVYQLLLLLFDYSFVSDSFSTPWTVACQAPLSSVHGILQARILGWVAISSSRGSSQPRD